MSVKRILQFADRQKLDFVMLTDHETINGSLELLALVQASGKPIEVPIAAEYCTSHGDVIAAFIQREIESRDIHDFIAEVREQGGLLLLPHPYDHHREVEQLAGMVDLIEVFNARSSKQSNAKAVTLAASAGKPGYWAPDAHIADTLKKVSIEVERCGSLKESLRSGDIRPVIAERASKADVWLSQYAKAVRHRNVRLAWNITLSIGVTGLRRLINR
jgi:hypothetical protein